MRIRTLVALSFWILEFDDVMWKRSIENNLFCVLGCFKAVVVKWLRLAKCGCDWESWRDEHGKTAYLWKSGIFRYRFQILPLAMFCVVIMKGSQIVIESFFFRKRQTTVRSFKIKTNWQDGSSQASTVISSQVNMLYFLFL